MAQVIEEKELNKLNEKHDKAFLAKAEKQFADGKDFELDPYGPGVVPEGVWKKAKKDGEAVES